MRASLAVSSDCEDICFYARVSVDKGDGIWYLLRDDITTMRADGRDYVPGTEKTLSLAFPRLAFRLEKGDRLRVDVSSVEEIESHRVAYSRLESGGQADYDKYAADLPRSLGSG